MRRRRWWLSAWTLGPLLVGGLVAAIMLVALGATMMSITGAEGACGTSQPAGGIAASGPGQVAGIRQELLAIYEQAASKYSLGPDGWAYLAAINWRETDFGHDLSASSAGAIGWMQFMPDSWRSYGVDANGDGTADPYDKWDAIFAAAKLLRASGAPGTWSQARSSPTTTPAGTSRRSPPAPSSTSPPAPAPRSRPFAHPGVDARTVTGAGH